MKTTHYQKENSFPKLATRRLLLRGISEADCDAYQTYFEDFELVRYLNHNVPYPYPKGAAKDWVLNHILPRQGLGFWFWAICEKDRPEKLLGGISIEVENGVGSRGFWLGSPHQGKGYMTEACEAVTDYAFGALDVEKFILKNATKIPVFEKVLQ